MPISFTTHNVDMPDINSCEVIDWVKRVAACYGKRCGDISYIFCDDERILEVNRAFLQHDYYTDIITFDTSDYPESPKDAISGELYISVDTVRANAEEYGSTFPEEMHRVIIHGVLHLIGFDDHEPEDIQQMRNAEAQALAQLKDYGITI